MLVSNLMIYVKLSALLLREQLVSKGHVLNVCHGWCDFASGALDSRDNYFKIILSRRDSECIVSIVGYSRLLPFALLP